MRILYFSSRECWPLNTGARLRDYHFARELSRRARVTYLGLRNPKDPPPVDPPSESGFERHKLVEKDPSFSPMKLVRGLAGPVPVTVLNNSSPRILGELERTLREGESFASVQIEGMHLVEYLPALRRAPGKPAFIADWHNIESEIMWRYSETAVGAARKAYARRTARLMEDMELRLLEDCDVHVVPSSREREILLARCQRARIEIVGNGVDVAYYSDLTQPSDRRDVLFVGSMDYHANIGAALEFANAIWPGILARHPELRFVVVGRNPPPEIRALASLPKIEVTGTVDDVRPWYRSARVVVVPLRTGSGTRLKILEAMAAGVPVVSTRLGAEGLDIADGENILLAETAQEMIEAVDALYASPEKWHALAEAGRELVRTQYDWAILGERLFAIHESASRKS